MVRKRERNVKPEAIEKFGDNATDNDNAESENGKTYKILDPGVCEPWSCHNRSKLSFDTEDAKRIYESIKSIGQNTPALVRETDGERYEIIYGARRWDACSKLGINFEARVLPKETPDIDCAKAMEAENRESVNTSEMETALSYKLLLDKKVFKNQTELATSYNITKQYVQKLVSASEVMEHDWLSAILGPVLLSISIKNASTLLSAMKSTKSTKDLKAAAESIRVNNVKDAKEIFKILISSVIPKDESITKVIEKAKGKATVSLKKDTKGVITLRLLSAEIDKENIQKTLEIIQVELKKHLETI